MMHPHPSLMPEASDLVLVPVIVSVIALFFQVWCPKVFCVFNKRQEEEIRGTG
jgi:hypothetical protein